VVASLTVLADGRLEDATPDALELLGVTLDELRELPPGAFSADAPDPEGDAAFRAEWESSGRPDVGGEGTLRRLDGSRVRVRFAITPSLDDRFVVVLEAVGGATEAPPIVFTGGEVIARWRAAERRLETLEEGSPEAASVQAEIDHLRGLYQGLFRPT
jgi:hypothetical protein